MSQNCDGLERQEIHHGYEYHQTQRVWLWDYSQASECRHGGVRLSSIKTLKFKAKPSPKYIGSSCSDTTTNDDNV